MPRPAICYLLAALLLGVACADPTGPQIRNDGGVGTHTLTVQAFLVLRADSSLAGLASGGGGRNCRVDASVLVIDSLGAVTDAVVQFVGGIRDTIPLTYTGNGAGQTGSRRMPCSEDYSLTVYHGTDSIAGVRIASPGAPVVLAPSAGESVPAGAPLRIWWIPSDVVSPTQNTEIAAAPDPVLPPSFAYQSIPFPIWVTGDPGHATAPAGWLGASPVRWRLMVTTMNRIVISGGRFNSFVLITGWGNSGEFCVEVSCLTH